MGQTSNSKFELAAWRQKSKSTRKLATNKAIGNRGSRPIAVGLPHRFPPAGKARTRDIRLQRQQRALAAVNPLQHSQRIVEHWLQVRAHLPVPPWHSVGEEQ